VIYELLRFFFVMIKKTLLVVILTKTLPIAEQFGPNARFGTQGSIHTEEECAAAQGLWIPMVFNWMTHVYPNEQQKWGGMDMEMEARD
jgi:hypothetical protein